MYDVIIVGGGPAGLTAAIYTARKKLKTLILTVDIGGQTVLTEHIENYPGYTGLSGPKLVKIFEQQIKNFDVKIIFGKVVKVKKIDDNFKVILSNGESYESKALILANGKIPRSLGIPGEEKFVGRGVSTCTTCDSPLFRNKIVAVIGGGNNAFEAAELLTKFASKIYLVHRREGFRADEVTVKKVEKDKKVEFVLNSVAKEIKGKQFVESLVVQNIKTQEKKRLKVNGIFVEIGYETKTDWVKNLVKLNEYGEIIVNEYCETSCAGVFAAGDVTNVPYKQLVIAAGAGAIAGLSAYNYLQKIEGKPGIKVDWGKKRI